MMRKFILLVTVPVQDGIAKLRKSGLEPGLYYGRLEGDVYLIPFGLN